MSLEDVFICLIQKEQTVYLLKGSQHYVLRYKNMHLVVEDSVFLEKNNSYFKCMYYRVIQKSKMETP